MNSQNLIVNSGFEIFKIEDCGIVCNFQNIKNWSVIGGGYRDKCCSEGEYCTTNFYSKYSCLEVDTSNIHNGIGAVKYDLNNYGFDDYYGPNINLFCNELKNKLEEGKEYYFEMYLKISPIDKVINSTKKTDLQVFAVNENFIENLNINQINTDNFKLSPVLSIDFNKKISDFENWKLISCSFVASGDEQYLLIGNRTGKGTQKRILIDDLLLIEKSQLELLNLNQSEVGDTLTFRNILFETNSSKISESSNDMLDFVYDVLLKNPTVNIEISGHTDNVGTSEFNQQLSQDRAKAVCDYLISKGISAERLTSTGYGDTKPIADNSTDVGKAQNRRVEFIILKK